MNEKPEGTLDRGDNLQGEVVPRRRPSVAGIVGNVVLSASVGAGVSAAMLLGLGTRLGYIALNRPGEVVQQGEATVNNSQGRGDIRYPQPFDEAPNLSLSGSYTPDVIEERADGFSYRDGSKGSTFTWRATGRPARGR